MEGYHSSFYYHRNVFIGEIGGTGTLSKIFKCSKTFEHNTFENELDSPHSMHVDRDCNVGHNIAAFVTAVSSLFWSVIKGRLSDFAKVLLIPEHVFPFCLYIVGPAQCLEEEEKRGWGGRERPGSGG